MTQLVRSEESDAELLGEFADHRSEAAFAALVRRHGRMVRGVCGRILDDRASADDAFQAAFLVLAAKAGTLRRRLRPGKSLGAWLNRVAHNAAIQIWRSEAARSRRERIAGIRSVASTPDDGEGEAILDEEMQGLPEKYRAPLVLHYLEEKSQPATADELGLTVGTLRRRLDRGKELLRRRLVRRGIAVSIFGLGEHLRRAGAIAAPGGHSSGAAIAASIRAGRGLRSVPGVSGPTIAAGRAVIRAMGLRTLARAVGLAIAPALILLAAALVAYAAPARPRPRPVAEIAPRSVTPIRPTERPRIPAALPETKAPAPPKVAAHPPVSPPVAKATTRGPSYATSTRSSAPLTADPAPLGPSFVGEININGRVARFENADDFARAQQRLAGPIEMMGLTRSPGMTDPQAGDRTSRRRRGRRPSPGEAGMTTILPDGNGFTVFGAFETSTSMNMKMTVGCCCEGHCGDPAPRSDRPSACRCMACPSCPKAPPAR